MPGSMTLTSTDIRVLLIDNYDSYSYNLWHLFGKVLKGVEPTVVRADAFPTFKALTDALGHFDAVVISPGPGTPHSANDFLKLPADTLRQRYVPVLGVCLGHQALCVAYGANVVRAPAGPVHGQLSNVKLDLKASSPFWDDVPSKFSVVRYHSLAVDPATLSSALVATAWTSDEETPTLMAVQHRRFPLFGVQFHPESISTEHGVKIAANFANIARKLKTARAVPWMCLRDDNFPRPLRRRRNSYLKNTPKELGEKLQVVYRCLDHVSMESSDMFSRLFNESVPSFWLDSSSNCGSVPSISRCSSPRSSPNKELVETSSGRFSIMGNSEGPRAEIVTCTVTDNCTNINARVGKLWKVEKKPCSIFEYLKEQLKRKKVSCPAELPLEMNGGYVGFFGYELKKEIPGVSINAHSSKLPDAWFIFADRVLIVDHATDRVYLVAVIGKGRPSSRKELKDANAWFSFAEGVLNSASLSQLNNAAGDTLSTNALSCAPLRFSLERSKPEYIGDIKRCLEEIEAGESYEICLTNRLKSRVPKNCRKDPFDVYKALRDVNPAPYSAFLRLSADTAICCSSPERFLQITSDGFVESKPIKGTARRGDSFERDEMLRARLETSVKDRSENLMIVDLVRNDLGQTCETGSITVPRLMHVESYATVHQLVSTVRGKLLKGKSSVDCIRAAYPMGSMTGAPKVRTLDIIDRTERSARGAYSGSIGFLSLCGAADFNVVIRTAVLHGRDVEVGVGGAIVALSDPGEEFDEILVKGTAVMQALSLAVSGNSNFELR